MLKISGTVQNTPKIGLQIRTKDGRRRTNLFGKFIRLTSFVIRPVTNLTVRQGVNNVILLDERAPLICPLPVEGAFLIGARSGFALMASAAAGELLAAHVIGGELPPYASAFTLERYQDPAYQKLLESWGESGQL